MASYNPALRSQGGYKNGLESLLYRDRKLGHWSSTSEDGRRTIWHYTTRMLTLPIDQDNQPITDTGGLFRMSIGNGSVSDQGGMNRLFKQLGIPFYYSRKGGADISLLEDGFKAGWRMWPTPMGMSADRLRSVSVAEVLNT